MNATDQNKVLVTTFAFNEGVKIKTTVERILAATKHDVLVMDDGSTDGSMEALRNTRAQILSNQTNEGIGSAMKTALMHAKHKGYEIIVIMAGNNKDDPTQIPRLVTPLFEEGYDFVQGSRYLKGGDYGNMPLYRRVATQFVHPLLFSIITRKWITDSTNGFRAFRLKLLDDPRINIQQPWLDKYELEPYLFFKAIRLGYKVKEVPVTKIYPPHQLGYTKMKPITGWWSILRPIFLLGLGLRK
jgi:dolichol-phosphate mannosyltransferase